MWRGIWHTLERINVAGQLAHTGENKCGGHLAHTGENKRGGAFGTRWRE